MKVGDLKKALTRYPPDMDDLEVAVVYASRGKDHYDMLTFVGYLPIPDHECLVLGTWTAVDKLVKDGKLEPPEGFTPNPEDL
jgi:hypothetical protein